LKSEAYIEVDGVHKYRGLFNTKIEAQLARDEEARRINNELGEYLYELNEEDD